MSWSISVLNPKEVIRTPKIKSLVALFLFIKVTVLSSNFAKGVPSVAILVSSPKLKVNSLKVFFQNLYRLQTFILL